MREWKHDEDVVDEVQHTDGFGSRTTWRREHPRRHKNRLETERYVVDDKGEGIYEEIVQVARPEHNSG